MWTPSDCRWNKEVVYNAMWNLLCELRIHNKTRKETSIKRVFVTGLGTGVGWFPIDTCAKQMVLAYRHFLRNLNKETTTTWSEARDDGLEIEETYRTSFLSGNRIIFVIDNIFAIYIQSTQIAQKHVKAVSDQVL